MSRSNNLYKLQLTDSSMDEAYNRLSEIDSILQDRSALQQAKSHEEEAQAKLTEKSRLLKKAEDEVATQSSKIEQNQAKLYGGMVTNPKELEDLQLEASSLQKYLQVLEERQLEAMIEMDQAQETYQKTAEHTAKLENERKLLEAELENERKALEIEIEELTQKRTDQLDQIPQDDLGLYQKLRQKLGGIAVALMTNQSCAACGSNIPSAVEQKAKSPKEITQCTTCTRILHHP